MSARGAATAETVSGRTSIALLDGFTRAAEPLADMPSPIAVPLPVSDFAPPLLANAGPDQCLRERVQIRRSNRVGSRYAAKLIGTPSIAVPPLARTYARTASPRSLATRDVTGE
jgi:hypothetical protein